MTVQATLLAAIFGPVVVSGEYLYFRVVVPTQNTAVVTPTPKKLPIPAPFVDPGIIIVQPPAAQTTPETEPNVVIPETQRRTTGKHRAEETPTPPVTPPTTSAPRGDRRIAPATPSTPPVAPSTTPVAPPPSGSTARTEPPAPATPSVAPAVSSSTPIYDTLRNETLANDPNMETVIPE